MNNNFKIINIFFKSYLKEILHNKKDFFFCFISSLSLIVGIITVVIGFTLFKTTQQVITNNLMGIQPEYTVYLDKNCDYKLIEKQVSDYNISFSKWDYGAIIVDDEIDQTVLIKTISTDKYLKKLDKVIDGDINLLKKNFNIIVGEKLKENYSQNGYINIATLSENKLNNNKFKIVGTIKTGFDELDQSLAIIDTNSADWLFETDLDLLEIENSENISTKIWERTGLVPYSWAELNPALAVGIDVQAIATFIICILILFLSFSVMILAFYSYLFAKQRNTLTLIKQLMNKKTIFLIDYLVLFFIIIVSSLIALLTSILINLYAFGVINNLTQITINRNYKEVVYIVFILFILYSLIASLICYINLENCYKKLR